MLAKQVLCTIICPVYNKAKYIRKCFDSILMQKTQYKFKVIVIDDKSTDDSCKKTSYEIYNQIRAFIFSEYQLPVINNTKIEHVLLTNEFIGYNHFDDNGKDFIISDIDGYKILATKYTKNK